MSRYETPEEAPFVTARPDPWKYWATEEIVCPWCGDEQLDSTEYLAGRNSPFTVTAECQREGCEKTFDVECEYSVTFTSVLPPADGGA